MTSASSSWKTAEKHRRNKGLVCRWGQRAGKVRSPHRLMGSGLRHAASKNRGAAGFNNISRVSVAFPSGACCTSVRLTVAPERRPKKEANPASLRSAAPSKGRGLRGYSLLPMEGGAPKGRKLDGDGGMKKSGEMHLKQAINESTLSTADAVPLPQWGRLIGPARSAPLLFAAKPLPQP